VLVVVAAMICGRGGVSVCESVRGAVLVWLGWGVAELVSKRLADRSFFEGGWCCLVRRRVFVWWLLWEISCGGHLCFLAPNSLSLTLVLSFELSSLLVLI